MFLEELKKIFFKNENVGNLYLVKWVEIYRRTHPEKRRKIIELLKVYKENENVLGELLDRFSPESSSSEEEKVAFFTVYLYWLVKTMEECKRSEAFPLENARSFINSLKEEKLEKVLLEITSIIIGEGEVDVLNFLSKIKDLAEKLGSEKYRKQKHKKEELGKTELLEIWYLDRYVQSKARERRPMSLLCDKMFEYYICIAGEDRRGNGGEDDCVTNAICAQILYNADRNEEAIEYAKRSLCLKNPAARKNAFIILGNCCIDAGRKYWQLAFDTFYSWLNCQMTGELSNVIIDFSAEKEWRSKGVGKKEEAQMWNNYAYLCSVIGDNLTEGSQNQKIFREYALTLMKNAIELERKNLGFNCTYGTLFRENENFQQALKYYDKYFNFAKEKEKIDIVSALRHWTTACRDLIFECFNAELYEDQTKRFFAKVKIKKYFDEYYDKMKLYYLEASDLITSSFYHTKNAVEEIQQFRRLEQILKLHEFFEHEKEISSTIGLMESLLLLIDSAVDKIENKLQKKDYGVLKIDLRDQQRQIYAERSENVAYYTTLDTIKFLFAKLYQLDKNQAPYEKTNIDGTEEGKNCLTMMHAMYMNDPNEGLTLLQSFENNIKDGEERNNLFDGMSSVEFRQGMYDKNYIFLKAFTPRIDQLDMWAMYASDRETGSDSNGCCVCLNPETFRRAIDMRTKPDNKNIESFASKEKEVDDFHLYRVVYVGNEGDIKKEKNLHLPEKVIDYYESLKCLIKMLNECLDELFRENISQNKKEDIRNYVRGFLQYSFRIVAFLFKEDSYFLEEELRLIVTKSHEQKDSIRKLNTNPPKLCINPFFQVYIDKLILGPKVKNMDEWIPYFQYELNNMRKDGFPEQVVVRKSKIHYRD